jgi:hypothetical protein
MKFQRHTREWFINRIGEEIRMEIVHSSCTAGLDTTKPMKQRIDSISHAESLFLFHKTRRINFHEVDPVLSGLRVKSHETTTDNNIELTRIALVDEDGRPAGSVVMQSKPGLNLGPRLVNQVKSMIKEPSVSWM